MHSPAGVVAEGGTHGNILPVNLILIALTALLLETNVPTHVGLTNLSAPNVWRANTDTNTPAYAELRALMIKDEEASDEVERWIKDSENFDKLGAGTSKATLSLKVEQRFEVVEKLYQAFIEKYPKYAPGFLAYGSFLMDVQKEDEGVKQYERALELDPKNPAVFNNLANHYGHRGPVQKAFGYYETAIKLAPTEPVYYQNFATTVYLFRKDVQEYYRITEPEVFDKALGLYRKAMEIDPKNFLLATDLAQSYYGIKPMRTNDALQAWTHVLNLATNDVERQGTYLHLARVEMNTGRFAESRAHLNMVTNVDFNELKERLEKAHARKSGQTNVPAVKVKPEAPKTP